MRNTLIPLIALLAAACGAKTTYIPEEPLHRTDPPVWVGEPARLTEDGGFQVRGLSDNLDLIMAKRLAQLDARANAARIFTHALRLIERESRLTPGNLASLPDASSDLRVRIDLNTAGLVPAQEWYDPDARIQYVLLEMPRQHFEALFGLKTRAVLLDVFRELQIRVVEPEEKGR